MKLVQAKNLSLNHMLNLRDAVSWIDRLLTQNDLADASLLPADIDTPDNAELKQRIENARLAYQRLPVDVRERIRLTYETQIQPGAREAHINALPPLLELIEHQSRINNTQLANTLRDGAVLNTRVRTYHAGMNDLLHRDRTVKTLEETERLLAHWRSLPTEDFDRFSSEKEEEKEDGFRRTRLARSWARS